MRRKKNILTRSDAEWRIVKKSGLEGDSRPLLSYTVKQEELSHLLVVQARSDHQVEQPVLRVEQLVAPQDLYLLEV